MCCMDGMYASDCAALLTVAPPSLQVNRIAMKNNAGIQSFPNSTSGIKYSFMGVAKIRKTAQKAEKLFTLSFFMDGLCRKGEMQKLTVFLWKQNIFNREFE